MHRFFGWLRARLATQDLAALAFTAWVASFTLRAHLRFIAHPFQHSTDEGYLLAVGMRMLDGHMLPYVDGVAHTGPLFLYTGALIAALNPFSWLPIRIVAGVTYTLMPLLLFAVARQLRRPLAGALAGLAIPVVTILRWSPVDGVAYNAETPELLCTLGALYGVLRIIREPARAWCALAGASTAGIALSKQVGALQAAVIVVGFAFALLAHGERRERLGLLAAFVGAALLPALAIVGWLGLHGALADAYYYLVTYNRDVYMYHLRNEDVVQLWRGWLETQTLEVTLLIAVLAWGLAQAAIAQARSWRRPALDALFPLLVVGLAITGVIGARASQRDFGHYYMMAMPWLALLLGMMAEQSFTAPSGRWRVVLLLPIVCAVELAWDARQDTLKGWSDQQEQMVPLAEHAWLPRVCTIINAHSKRGDKLFVWGFRPGLYVSCRRWPASRFVFTTFVSGFVPWNLKAPRSEEDQLAVPGSRALLISELEATKPPVIIDAPKSMGGRSMTAYPETGDYLRAHYALLSRERDVDVWVREGF